MTDKKTTIRRVYRDFNHVFVDTTQNRYTFAPVTADKIRGGTETDIEGLYVYVGNSMMNNYPAENSLDSVPQNVIDAVADKVTLVENIDSGWYSWDGRPEFSTSYVDISEMEIREG